MEKHITAELLTKSGPLRISPHLARKLLAFDNTNTRLSAVAAAAIFAARTYQRLVYRDYTLARARERALLRVQPYRLLCIVRLALFVYTPRSQALY